MAVTQKLFSKVLTNNNFCIIINISKEKGENKMYDIIEIFLYILGIIAIIALAIGISLAIVSYFVWLVYWGFGWDFSWKVAIGIWALLVLLNMRITVY